MTDPENEMSPEDMAAQARVLALSNQIAAVVGPMDSPIAFADGMSAMTRILGQRVIALLQREAGINADTLNSGLNHIVEQVGLAMDIAMIEARLAADDAIAGHA